MYGNRLQQINFAFNLTIDEKNITFSSHKNPRYLTFDISLIPKQIIHLPRLALQINLFKYNNLKSVEFEHKVLPTKFTTQNIHT